MGPLRLLYHQHASPSSDRDGVVMQNDEMDMLEVACAEHGRLFGAGFILIAAIPEMA